MAKVTNNAELNALAIEAHRRGVSYGHLVSHTSEREQQEIIQRYREERAGGKKNS